VDNLLEDSNVNNNLNNDAVVLQEKDVLFKSSANTLNGGRMSFF